jgi:hypothetical protein
LKFNHQRCFLHGANIELQQVELPNIKEKIVT